MATFVRASHKAEGYDYYLLHLEPENDPNE